MSKIVLIGANHAGIAAANTILDSYPENEVVIIDKNTNLSYLGCGTALWVGRHIDSYEHLFYTNKEAFEEKGARILMETTVESIDFDNKLIHATRANGEKFEESYDKVILATGSVPIAPNIKGTDLENVQFVKLFQDSQVADKALCDDSIKEVAVIGAGYIGVEMAEAVKRRGKNVRLFDAADTSLNTYYDPWFTEDMDNVLTENGIQTHYGEMVQSFEGKDGKVTDLTTDKGTYKTDLVIMAIGFSPNNSLGKDKLETFNNGAYLVNLKQETSLPDVYAVGDCATIYSNAIEDTTYIALATNAVRSGIVGGHNAAGTPLESIGVQGSNGISIFGYNMVSTGLNLAAAKEAGYEVKYTDFEDLQKPGFIEKNGNVKIRIVYDAKTRRVLGAQMASTEDISMGIHMFSLAIEEKVTIDKLKLLDIFFLPHFNQPYNYITMAALSAE
ncbi:H2O-forming NADH oxidase [Vagococcus carniphilus]|uniref:NADH oxidase n=1 Tax=Vagococcus carniphilus TaxID=218144 RepID=A0A430B6R4_9ENTE|nr:FAD-dependent oxidoreductase [Vagococcus carniphilus]QNN72882.1 FAD-dependent oxidoreductase [Vagococcus carniphilus]RSU15989.1 NADH oxidase [Vagococcus carniphilus]